MHYCLTVFTEKTNDLDKVLAPYYHEKQCEMTKEEVFDKIKRLHPDVTDESELVDLIEDELGISLDHAGNPTVEFNPDGKYDYYTIGGRWSWCMINGKTGEYRPAM